jgi:hypothetical protein
MNYLIMIVGITAATLLKKTGYNSLGHLDLDIIVAFATGAGWGVLTTRKAWHDALKEHVG